MISATLLLDATQVYTLHLEKKFSFTFLHMIVKG